MTAIVNSRMIILALIDLEQAGYTFYQEAAEGMEEGVVKNLFLKLAKDEQAHEKTYKELLEKYSDTTDILVDEDESYLKLMLDFNTSIINEEKSEKIKKVLSKREALIIAEKLEKDTIMVLNEVVEFDKDFNRSKAYKIAVKEEKNHLRMILNQLMDANVGSLML